MAVLKLSQIAAAGGAPAAGDQLVGVTGGATDNLFSLTQINTTVLNTVGLAVGSAKITGGSSGSFLYDNAGVLGERTPTQATAALNLFTNTLQGLVSGSGGGTTNFLRADDTWAVPAGTPGGANTNVQFNNSSAFGGDSGFTYAGSGQVTHALGTITANAIALNITGTWNAGGVTFDAPLLVNITNTASATGSKFADFQLAGTGFAAFQSFNLTNIAVANSALVLQAGTPLICLGTSNTSGIAFNSSGDIKIEYTGAALAFSTNRGSFLQVALSSAGLALANSIPLNWTNSGNGTGTVDTSTYRDATSGIYAVSAKPTAASTIRVYNTTDNIGTGTAPTNYERGVMDWTTSANVLIVGTQNNGTGSARAMNLVTGGTNAITVSTAQAVAFPGVGTTASAANAFLDNAASNNLLRSTSSLRYKTAVTGVPSERIQALMALQPIEFQSRASADNSDTRFVGYAAEEVARIDPTLVSLDMEGRPDSVMYDRVLLLKVAALEREIEEMKKWAH